MADKRVLWASAGCVAASALPFWLWKSYSVTGPTVGTLIWFFVMLFGLAQLFSFAAGIQFIFRSTRKWIPRGFLIVGLMGCEAYVSLMAALGMNFVGQ